MDFMDLFKYLRPAPTNFNVGDQVYVVSGNFMYKGELGRILHLTKSKKKAIVQTSYGRSVMSTRHLSLHVEADTNA